MHNSFLLIWGLQVLQPCFINISVALLRLGWWCIWLLQLSAPWWEFLFPLGTSPLTQLVKCSTAEASSLHHSWQPACVCVRVSATTGLAGRDLAARRDLAAGREVLAAMLRGVSSHPAAASLKSTHRSSLTPVKVYFHPVSVGKRPNKAFYPSLLVCAHCPLFKLQ